MSEPAMAPVLRRVNATDAAFMRALFVASRPELQMLASMGPAGEQLIDLQVRAQHTEYTDRYPRARDHVVTLMGAPVGRCWTSESGTDLRLLDLAVLPESRRRGVARAVLGDLCRRAAELAVPMRLRVWHENVPARRLYAALSFRETDESGGYVAMEWCPTEEASSA